LIAICNTNIAKKTDKKKAPSLVPFFTKLTVIS
jgi:hypothetical protein